MSSRTNQQIRHKHSGHAHHHSQTHLLLSVVGGHDARPGCDHSESELVLLDDSLLETDESEAIWLGLLEDDR